MFSMTRVRITLFYKFISFSSVRNLSACDVYLSDTKLEKVQSVNHLGYILTSSLTYEKDILIQLGAYNSKADTILSDLKLIGLKIPIQILQSYCSCFYESQLWDLSNNCIDKFGKSWRKSIRHIMYMLSIAGKNLCNIIYIYII